MSDPVALTDPFDDSAAVAQDLQSSYCRLDLPFASISSLPSSNQPSSIDKLSSVYHLSSIVKLSSSNRCSANKVSSVDELPPTRPISSILRSSSHLSDDAISVCSTLSQASGKFGPGFLPRHKQYDYNAAEITTCYEGVANELVPDLSSPHIGQINNAIRSDLDALINNLLYGQANAANANADLKDDSNTNFTITFNNPYGYDMIIGPDGNTSQIFIGCDDSAYQIIKGRTHVWNNHEIGVIAGLVCPGSNIYFHPPLEALDGMQAPIHLKLMAINPTPIPANGILPIGANRPVPSRDTVIYSSSPNCPDAASARASLAADMLASKTLDTIIDFNEFCGRLCQIPDYLLASVQRGMGLMLITDDAELEMRKMQLAEAGVGANDAIDLRLEAYLLSLRREEIEFLWEFCGDQLRMGVEAREIGVEARGEMAGPEYLARAHALRRAASRV